MMPVSLGNNAAEQVKLQQTAAAMNKMNVDSNMLLQM